MYMPRWVTMSGLWENCNLWYFGPFLVKYVYIFINVYIFFGGSRITFLLKMLLWRGIQGASKNPLGSLQIHVVLELWPPEVSILMKNLRDGWLKIAISRDFWHFSNFDVFLKREPRGIQKPKGGEPPKQLSYLRCGRRKFQFHWKTWGRAEKKITIFSNLGVQTLESPK